jgi:uncharacterized protein
MTAQCRSKRYRIFQFRPHHFMCTLGFQGKGYSPKFVQNYARIVSVLQGSEGDQQLIRVVSDCDSICQACPRRTEQSCQQDNTVALLDDAHIQVLGLEIGQIVRWGEVKQLIKDKMSLVEFHRVCSSCVWKNLGYCEDALCSLKENIEEKDPALMMSSL